MAFARGARDAFHVVVRRRCGPTSDDIHLTEVVVHGLDLAVATEQEFRVDEELSEQLLATMTSTGGIDAFRRPGIFGPEVTAESAPAHRRLLAYLGRSI